MTRRCLTRWAKTALSALLATVLVVPSTTLAQSGQGTVQSFSGQATVVRATVLGISTVISDTGPLPPSGGALEESLLEASVPGLLTAEVAHASVVGQDNASRAEASVAKLALTVGGNSIAAGFLMARATAQCTTNGPAAFGSSEIVGLVVNGQGIGVTGQPNQTILLPNGRIVINEQTISQDNKSADITVNALHIVINGLADVVISSAHADVVCHGKPVCPGNDFVTGGGLITDTPSRARANFGVAGGLKNGSLWGHLVYIDHGSRMKVKGTGVTMYQVVDATTRHIEGTAEINGRDGFTYQIDVSDKGEPSRDDTFSLWLSNGYVASGNLSGGNIQVHKCR